MVLTGGSGFIKCFIIEKRSSRMLPAHCQGARIYGQLLDYIIFILLATKTYKLSFIINRSFDFVKLTDGCSMFPSDIICSEC